MDERQDHQDRDNNSGDKAESEAAKASAASEGAAANDLPAVESPKLDGQDAGEEAAEAGHGGADSEFIGSLPALFSEPVNEAPNEPAAVSPAQPRSYRFVLLAATIACAAGIGALVGSLSASGIGHPHAAPAAIPRTADARDVIQALKAQLAELSSLKASLDGANRSAGAQFAKLGERLDSLERAQAEPATKLARIADALDRLDGRTGPQTTGSIAAAPPPAATSAPDPTLTAPVLPGWVVQDVRNGRAMLENRFGGLFLVGSGSVIPGVGRVQEVKRQNGEWIVVTEKGLITSRP